MLVIGAVVLAGMLVKSIDPLTSGDALRTVTTVVWLAFWAIVLLGLSRGFPAGDITDAEVIRAYFRGRSLQWGAFLVAYGVLAAWAVAVDRFEPWWVVQLVIVGLLLVPSLLCWASADRLAAKARARQGASA